MQYQARPSIGYYLNWKTANSLMARVIALPMASTSARVLLQAADGRYPGMIVDGSQAITGVGLAGYGIMICWPFWLHSGRRVGNQLTLYSLA